MDFAMMFPASVIAMRDQVLEEGTRKDNIVRKRL